MTRATPSAQALGGDELVAVLSPDAHLVIDASHNVVICTAERRVTVTDAGRWANKIMEARMRAAAEWERSEEERRPNGANWRRDNQLAAAALHTAYGPAWLEMPAHERSRMIARFRTDYAVSVSQLDLDSYARHWAGENHV
jgi:hypothetical protein